ncbi:MucBP domain-containing protein [Limosilactobacillus difficilis]|uniref:MucBP domain-containing protein n=1 Tax=Limosilactobacillus difficilis TaxID=2991838 RepID=UPI0024BAA802|nr:MucBP domain-containing protein [Limosilactobacillus difficilis]
MDRAFKTGNPIWVYFIDLDSGENLKTPKLLRGFVDTKYQVEPPKIDNYRYMKAEGDLSGHFDMRQHMIKLYYRHKDWGEVQTIELFLRLKRPVQAYDQVAGMPIEQPIPAGIIIKSFKRVATYSREFWYEIGSDHWVQFKDRDMELVDQPFPKEANDKPQTAQFSERDIDKTGIVDYVKGIELPVYANPYGEVLKHVSNGSKLQLVSELDDENGVKWYHLKDQGYVNAAYVNLI